MRLIVSVVFSLEKFGKNLPFFWAATAGLGKYSMGGYGQIGVKRVKLRNARMIPDLRSYL